jgi:hypothetical protein
MVLTERLEVRLPVEADRLRFVELIQDPLFMECTQICRSRAPSFCAAARQARDALGSGNMRPPGQGEGAVA